MRSLTKYVVLIMVLVAGTGATSCVLGGGGNIPVETTVAVADMIQVQVYNTRHEGFMLYAVWNGGRKELGYVPTMYQIAFDLDVPDGTPVAVELHFDSGYRCITDMVPLYRDNAATLRMQDGPVPEMFCAPVKASAVLRMA